MSGSPAARVRATTFWLALVIGLPSLATAYQVRFEAGQACTFALLVDVVGGAAIQVRKVRSVGHQTSGFDMLPRDVHRWQSRA